MANIKVFNLNSPDPDDLRNGFSEEFVEAVSSAVNRALASHELQTIRGGSFDTDPIIAGAIDSTGFPPDYPIIGTGYGLEEV